MSCQTNCSAGYTSSELCGWTLGKRDPTPCHQLRRRIHTRIDQDQCGVRNIDLPKVEKWLSRLNECGKPISSKNWCRKDNTSHVWELVGFRMFQSFGAWAYAEPPFTTWLAFSHDGIGFIEEGKASDYIRCKKYEDFIPVSQGDYQWPDPIIENQWTREERTIGPKNIIRPLINSSEEFIPVINLETKRGIVCFYDKLWMSMFCTYINAKSTTQYYNCIDYTFDFVFQPVQMSRMDYIEHLISRTKCGATCYPQSKSIHELECENQPCYFKSLDKYTDEEKVLVKSKGGVDKEVTGKNLKAKETSCWEVCTVSEDNPCIECKNALRECESDKIKMTDEIIKLKKDLKDSENRVKSLQAQNSKLSDLVQQFRAKISCHPDSINETDQIQLSFSRVRSSIRKLINYSSYPNYGLNPEFLAFLKEELILWERDKPLLYGKGGKEYIFSRIKYYVDDLSTGTPAMTIVGLYLYFNYIFSINNCARVNLLFQDGFMDTHCKIILKKCLDKIGVDDVGPDVCFSGTKCFICFKEYQNSQTPEAGKNSEREQGEEAEESPIPEKSQTPVNNGGNPQDPPEAPGKDPADTSTTDRPDTEDLSSSQMDTDN